MENDASFDISHFLKHLTTSPGVYKMLHKSGEVLYVGKAKNLKNRVSSYFIKGNLTSKNSVLISQINSIEVIITHSESEALILENNLIKALQPHYNILLRDDKSYPYIFISKDKFPKLTLSRKIDYSLGQYFGPYPHANAARETITLLQEIFLVRQCTDTTFNNRTRPCLEYQIKRCTAPCVGFISEKDYQEDIHLITLFLSGKSKEIIDSLEVKMKKSVQTLHFEQAAHYRNQIASLKKTQGPQYIDSKLGIDFDIISVIIKQDIACIDVFFIRGGHNLGDKAFFPKFQGETTSQEFIAAFISQHYLKLEQDIPATLILSHELKDKELLSEILSNKKGSSVKLLTPTRGPKVKWVTMALANAENRIEQRLIKKGNAFTSLGDLQKLLQLPILPKKIECFDISHTQGGETTASCVVFDSGSPDKARYRQFNISNVTAGDDYGAMKQALTRHYSRAKKENKVLPDLLIVDGGKGQLSCAAASLAEIGLSQINILGIAKGVERKEGEETLFFLDKTPIKLLSDSKALHLLQHIRNEAHRFAITHHRKRSLKKYNHTFLEKYISGLGVSRRQKLFAQFGGVQEISKLKIEDLTQVKGIGENLAHRIYNYFHNRG
ncbi:excinuclease ABC subunit UvrC [Candidatus Nitrosacidococcus tergens]|uniref:UvrABC system protein C n=1 Tax=Candidatus Nitrosacidococcus tergens TaxID=553981 RepID=A0A7G1Q9S5_9GAMM|nr:excinuclease ABC subunit UvrC [Candidatus Nitrosacidococcus tergens]CAB1275971.1 excinuclease UvrABC, endonuclease subunit [Candidatus Nitrosacidococcus tergens]